MVRIISPNLAKRMYQPKKENFLEKLLSTSREHERTKPKTLSGRLGSALYKSSFGLPAQLFKSYIYEPETKRPLPASPYWDVADIQKLPVGSPERRKKTIDLATSLAFMTSTSPQQIKGVTPDMARKILKVKPNASSEQIKTAFRSIIKKEYPRTLEEIASRYKTTSAKMVTEAKDVLLKQVPVLKTQAPPAPQTPQPKLPISKGTISPDFAKRLAQEKIAKAETGITERLTQKPLEKGALVETPSVDLGKGVTQISLGSKVPTPLDEAISAKEKIISPEEIKRMVKPEAQEIVTDPHDVNEIRSSITEGQNILKRGTDTLGKPLTEGERFSIRKAIQNSQAKIGEGKITDKDYSVTDVTPAGFGPEKPVAQGGIDDIYHGTGEGQARNIQKEGLKTGQAIGSKGDTAIYFSDTEKYAETYAKRKSSYPVMLRVKQTGDIIPDPNTGLKGDFKTTKQILPENIEIKTPNGDWVPIKDWDFSTKDVVQPPISDKKPTPQQIEEAQEQEMAEVRGEVKVEEQILAEARGEVKAEAIKTVERKAGVDLKDVLKRMTATKEGEWSLPNIKGMTLDELAQDLNYTGGGTKEIERVGQPNVTVNQKLYDHLVMLKGGQPDAPKRQIIMPKIELPRIKKTAKKLRVGIRWKNIPEAPGQVRIFTDVVHAEPTKKTIAKVAKKEAVDIKREADVLYKEWQASYRSETMTSAQALNKGLKALKQSTDQSIKDRLDKEVARIFAPDYRTPEFVFDKFGLKDKIYTPLKTGEERMSKGLGEEYMPKANNWFNKVKKIKNYDKRIFDYMDGIEVNLSPSEIEVAKEARLFLKELADRMGLPAGRRITFYITHLFEPDFEGGKRVFPEELAKILDYITPNKEFNPFLEKRTGARGYKRSFFDAMDAYAYRAYRKIHLDKPLNQAAKYVDALPKQASEYTDKFLKNFKNRPSGFEKWLDQNVLQGLSPKTRNFLGNRPASKLTNLITTQIYRGTLGFNLGSALKNLTQGTSTFAELGSKYTTIGYSQLMSKGVKELKTNDVLSDMIVADYKNTSLRSGLRKMDNALFWFFETAEKINRGSAYYGAKQKFLDEGMAEKEAVSKAKEIVRKTQFAYGKLDTPLALQSPAGKLMFTLSTYPLKQAEFIGGYAKSKEWAKIARYIISSIAMVALVGDYLGIDYKDVLIKNIMPTFGIVPKTIKDLLGPDYKRDKSAKNILKILTIPGYGGIKKGAQAIRGESKTATGKTRFKIETPEDIVKTLLGGEWNTSGAEEYLKDIGIKDDRSFIDDLLYITTGKKEYAPKK